MLDRLTGLQNEARRRAAFIAMTDDELREYDQRGDRIAELLKRALNEVFCRGHPSALRSCKGCLPPSHLAGPSERDLSDWGRRRLWDDLPYLQAQLKAGKS